MEQYSLSNENIVSANKQAEKFLASVGVEGREALRIKLTLEEILLEYQTKFGEQAQYILKCTKRFSVPRIEIIMKGEACNPFEKGEDSEALIANLLAGLGLAPTWSYKNGTNYIVFTLKKRKISQTLKMAAAIVFSIAAGGLLTLLPEGVQSGVSEHFLVPMTTLFMGLIMAVSGPLVFLAVLSGICSMGSVETFGKIGKKTVMTILGCSAGVGFGLTAIATLFYKVTPGGGAGADFSQILDLIYKIVPNNLFTPFIEGNALQIVFIAVLFGISLLILSHKVSGVVTLIQQFEYVAQTVMIIISGLLPFVVFVIFVNLIIGGNLKEVFAFGKMLLVMLLLSAVCLVAVFLWVAIRKRISPILLLKKILPTFVIAFTTASSAAAFSTNVSDSVNKLGIDKKLVEFGMPLGQVLFKPSIFILLATMQLAFAEIYGIEKTLAWLILGYFTNYLLSVAVPPVAGGAVIGMTIAFSQLGIPLEVVGTAVAINMIYDFPATATNTVSWQLLMIDVADSLNMLDKEILHKDAE